MRNILTIAAALGLLCAASTANAQSLDAKGRCRDANGQVAQKKACRTVHVYGQDINGICRDERGRTANPIMCNLR